MVCVGDSMDPDGMVLLLNYRDDGITPYLSYFKDGLLEEKQVSSDKSFDLYKIQGFYYTDNLVKP